MTISPVTISLGFMPAFYTRHLGVTYGDAYYFDPCYRAEVECAESRFLHETLGQYGVGSEKPSPSPNLFIQPIDILKATQGAVVYCPPDATLETRGHAWAGHSVDEIARLDPRDAAHHPFIDDILAQYHALTRLYGERADLFGLKTGMLNIHAPYTTAHQLCGEDIFYLLLDDPDGARIVFDKVWAIYQAIFARISAEIDAPPSSLIYLGDCSASMLSAEQYREVVLPANQAIAAAFPQARYHSCGPSSHLLDDFAALPRVISIELGPGTDLARAVRRLPGVAMCPLVDPLVMRDGTPDDAAILTRDIVTTCASAPAITLCAWSFDRETPIANVAAMYDAALGAPIS